jgi:hypothetical protein
MQLLMQMLRWTATTISLTFGWLVEGRNSFIIIYTKLNYHVCTYRLVECKNEMVHQQIKSDV